MAVNSLTISLTVLFVTRVFAGFVFLEPTLRNKSAKDAVVSIGWFIYAGGPLLNLLDLSYSIPFSQSWLSVFVVMGSFCILLGLVLYFSPVSFKKPGIIFLGVSLVIVCSLFIFPDISPVITVSIQALLLLGIAMIVLFRRNWIIKTGGIHSYIWLSVFFILSLTATVVHLFIPSIDQSVKFLFTFMVNLFLYMVFLHFDRERSFREIEENKSTIAKSLQEKNILLKEIHHRVKNNMMVMISLLHFQKTAAKDPLLAEQLEKAQNRIEAMALVHEYLYEIKNMAHIQFKSYIEGLLANLKTIIGRDISIRLDIEDFRINPDQLVYCGLIINEIITNSSKHAFAASNEKYISIEAHRAENIELVLRDNGSGMPYTAPSPGESEGVGFKLISNLCIQLNAKMDINNEHGTVYHFSIPFQPLTAAS